MTSSPQVAFRSNKSGSLSYSVECTDLTSNFRIGLVFSNCTARSKPKVRQRDKLRDLQ